MPKNPRHFVPCREAASTWQTETFLSMYIMYNSAAMCIQMCLNNHIWSYFDCLYWLSWRYLHFNMKTIRIKDNIFNISYIALLYSLVVFLTYLLQPGFTSAPRLQTAEVEGIGAWQRPNPEVHGKVSAVWRFPRSPGLTTWSLSLCPFHLFWSCLIFSDPLWSVLFFFLIF